MTDLVNNPPHYKQGTFGEVECIDFTRLMTGDFSNTFKYIWRHKDKEKPIEDMRKAAWYIQDARTHNIPVFWHESDVKKSHHLAAKHILPVTCQLPLDHPYQALVEIAFAGVFPNAAIFQSVTRIISTYLDEW